MIPATSGKSSEVIGMDFGSKNMLRLGWGTQKWSKGSEGI
jgi:hypothetical protein